MCGMRQHQFELPLTSIGDCVAGSLNCYRANKMNKYNNFGWKLKLFLTFMCCFWDYGNTENTGIGPSQYRYFGIAKTAGIPVYRFPGSRYCNPYPRMIPWWTVHTMDAFCK